MRRTLLPLATVVLLAAVLISSSFASAQQQASSSTVPVKTVVTVLGPNFSPPPAIGKEDVAVYSGKDRQDVTSWVPAQGDNAGLQLAILIDDADSPTSIGTHFDEIKNFITSQPATTEVGIFYATSGSASAAADFSSDHAAVAKKLRLPLGRFGGASPSVYLSLQDLAAHWPANDMRHEVLMIASGIDRLHPGIDSPYVDQAIHKVQSSGVVVHTIYVGGPFLADLPFRMSIAWQNLVRVANDSGGQPFFQGFETPVNFASIFTQLDTVLKNQYLLTFVTPRSEKKKGQMRDIRIHVEQHDARLYYPAQVFVPGP